MQAVVSNPRYYNPTQPPKNIALRSELVAKFYIPPKRARKVSDAKVAVEFLSSSMERAVNNLSPYFTIASHRDNYTGTSISYRDVLLIRNKMMEEGYIRLVQQGVWSKNPEYRSRTVYKLSDAIYDRLLWTKDLVPTNLGDAIIRKSWNALSPAEKEEYKSHALAAGAKPRRSARGEPTDAAWKEHYHDSELRHTGVDVSDPAYLDSVRAINAASVRHVWEFTDGPLLMDMVKTEDGQYCAGEGTRKAYAGDFVYTRIFTDNTSRHGRFYCGAQRIPSALRRKLLVDGKQTVELDFKSFHPSLHLHLSGKEAPEDVYREMAVYFLSTHGKVQLTAADEAEILRTREQFKKIVTIGINNADTATALKAIFSKHGVGSTAMFGSYKELQGMYSAALSHPVLGQILDEDNAAMRLMNYDSSIMELVMHACAAERIAFLSIHDSVVVPLESKDRVVEIMRESYRTIVGCNPAGISEDVGEPVPANTHIGMRRPPKFRDWQHYRTAVTITANK